MQSTENVARDPTAIAAELMRRIAELSAINAELVAALEALLAYENDSEPGFLEGDLRIARAALAKAGRSSKPRRKKTR